MEIILHFPKDNTIAAMPRITKVLLTDSLGRTDSYLELLQKNYFRDTCFRIGCMLGSCSCLYCCIEGGVSDCWRFVAMSATKAVFMANLERGTYCSLTNYKLWLIRQDGFKCTDIKL